MRTDFLTIETRSSSASFALRRFVVSEIVKGAVASPTGGTFSGGAGEAQFSSFLADEYANIVAQRIDIFKGKLNE